MRACLAILNELFSLTIGDFTLPKNTVSAEHNGFFPYEVTDTGLASQAPWAVRGSVTDRVGHESVTVTVTWLERVSLINEWPRIGGICTAYKHNSCVR